MKDRLLTANDVARFLSVKPSWVYAEARAGRMPHIRLGRYTRFSQASIEAWIEQRERGPIAPRDETRWEATRRSEP